MCAQTRSDAALFLFGFVSAVYTNGGAPVGAAVLQNRRSRVATNNPLQTHTQLSPLALVFVAADKYCCVALRYFDSRRCRC